MRLLVHISLLAAALCAAADATYVNYAPMQAVVQPVQLAYPAQAYGYNLPPVQRYILLNGQPYAVLGEQTQYLPAASAAPYTAQPTQAGAAPPAVTVSTAVAPEAASPVAPVDERVAPASSPAAAAPEASSSAGAAASGQTPETTSYAAPAPAVAPDVAPAEAPAPAAAEAPAPAPSLEPAPERTIEPLPVPATEPATVPTANSEPAVVASTPADPGRGLDTAPAVAVVPAPSPEPTAAPAPSEAPTVATATRGGFDGLDTAAASPVPSVAAQPNRGASVYLSAASEPSVPLAQRFLVLSVNNPKVTVRRKDTVYSWHHPEQTTNLPVKMVFYTDPKAPASGPVEPGTKSFGFQSTGLTATINPQPNEIPGSAPTRLTVYSQPATGSVYSAAPQPATTTVYSAAPQPATTTVYSAAPQPATTVYSSALQSPTTTVYSAAPQPATTTVYSATPQPATGSLYTSASQPATTVYSSAPQPPTTTVYSSAPQPATTTVYSQPAAPQPATAADLIRYTLSQSPLLRVYVDPATRTSYYLDSQGRRIDLLASSPAAAPVPLQPTSNNYVPTASAPSEYTQAAPQYYGSAKGMPSPFGPSASENYKAYDMAGLGPLERMYAPSTFNGPVPQSPGYDKPLTLSISTGKSAETGPASPLSPGDAGPSRGDSVENSARPKPLWSDARAR